MPMEESVKQVGHVFDFYNIQSKKILLPDKVMYIGRASHKLALPESWLHNPFKLHDPNDDHGRQQVIDQFERYLREKLTDMNFKDKFMTCIRHNNIFVCWCRKLKGDAHNRACHGDVIIKLYAEEVNAQNKRSAKVSVEDDGVTHINVYSKGKTKLGRMLSNFSYTPFRHPTYGAFSSMEAYWYYIKAGFHLPDSPMLDTDRNYLKHLYGNRAKSFGKMFPVVRQHNFDDLILEGLACKITQCVDIRDMLISNNLPLMHYYVFGKNHVIIPKDGDKLINMILKIKGDLVKKYS